MSFLKKFLAWGIVLAALAVAAGLWWLQQPLLKKPVQVLIAPGVNVTQISRQVVAAGVPLPPWVLSVLIRLTGNQKKIKSGGYVFQTFITPLTLVEQLALGPNLQSSITIVEGWTLHQMRAALAANRDVLHDAAHLTEAQLLQKLNAQEVAGALPYSRSYPYSHAEGLFFPDTYLFAAGSSEVGVYRQAYQALQKYLLTAWKKRAPDLPYTTPYEALIMASIIEKETGKAAERTLIAGVFINRLKKNMPLQTDPTVIYGMGKTFNGNLQKKDLLADTSYNTYVHTGLPPTPIALPSAASIDAALHPAATDALYFVARGDGSSHFSNTLSEHERAVNRYQRKLRTAHTSSKAHSHADKISR